MIAFDAPAVARGVGVFETILLVGRRLSLFDEHVARMRRTLARFDLPAPEVDELVDAAGRALADQPDEPAREASLRLTWMAVAKDVWARDAWRLHAAVNPIPPLTQQRRGGCHAVTLPRELQRDTPELKSTSYLGAVLGLHWAQRKGANEGLFVASDGTYLEGTAAALVAWRDGALVRPASGVLPSVTAAAFERFARLEQERRPVTGRDLLAGALVVGALTAAAPLVTLDGEPCAQPPSMLERIAEFNRQLVADAKPLPVARAH